MTTLKELTSDLPDSPCIGLCSTQFEDVCRGCGRTMEEVTHWIFMGDEEKRKVWIRVINENALRPKEEKAIRFRDTHWYPQYTVEDFQP